jgi:hypothetical protein
LKIKKHGTPTTKNRNMMKYQMFMIFSSVWLTLS